MPGRRGSLRYLRGAGALRYGYVPKNDNPQGKSITEMEYDKAVDAKRPKLAFMLDIDDEDFGWPPMGAVTRIGMLDSNIAASASE